MATKVNPAARWKQLSKGSLLTISGMLFARRDPDAYCVCLNPGRLLVSDKPASFLMKAIIKEATTWVVMFIVVVILMNLASGW